MFTQSFENSNKQQQRRRERQLAMQRMEDAANLVDNAANTTISDAVGDEKKPASKAKDNPKEKVKDKVKLLEKKVKDKPKDRPWKTGTTTKTTNSFHSATSVTSASNFLRKTQQQHALEHPPRSPPSPALTLKGRLESTAAKQFLWDDQSSVTSGYTHRSTMVNLHDIKNSFRSSDGGSDGSVGTSNKLKRNKGQVGRGSRWSAIHGLSGNSNGRGLWSALPLWGGGQEAADSNSVTSGGRLSKYRHEEEEGEHLLHLASGKYRDEEGERLLNLASERLATGNETKKNEWSTINISGTNDRSNSDMPIVENMAALQEEANEYGEEKELIEDDDDDSFMQEQGHRRVFLDKEGNLSYDNNHYNLDNDDLFSRRMMNQYRRALKRPLVLVCAAAAIIAIMSGAGALYSKVLHGIGGGGSSSMPQTAMMMPGGGDVSGGNGSASMDATGDDDWADSFNAEMNSNTSEENTLKQDLLNSNTSEEEAEEEDVTPKEELPPLDKQRFDHIRYTLIDQGASPPEVFLDKQSAQYAALAWLTRDDPRQLDPDSVYLGQRYGLAVLWFSTTKSGYQWHVPEEYSYDGDEEEDGADEDNRNSTSDYHEQNNNANEWPPRHHRNLQQKDPNVWFHHDHWLSSNGICGWEGIQCHPHENANVHDSTNDGDVSHVQLRRNNLHGLIPNEIYNTFPYLKVLDLSDNGLAGTISEEIGKNWKDLESLNFTSNSIAGSLPSAIGRMYSLKELHWANNLLGESIPHSIGTLHSLKHLDLSGNSIQGTIPYELGQLKELSSLNVSWNLLVGPIPHEFSELRDTLMTLDVSHNNLGGPLVVELGSITYLTILRLNDNHFSGELPAEIGDLIHLEELRLNNNDFRGTLPAEISNLDGLDSLNVANNYFEGEFPPEWTSMAGLLELDISSNELKGKIPIFIDGMKNLRSLNMAHNDFSSSIPSELGSLYKLEYLYLDDNEFESTVPKELGELTNIKKMALHNNYLTGQVDDHICKLADELFLTQLSVDCGGEMPEIFCDCCICHDHEPIVHLNTEP